MFLANLHYYSISEFVWRTKFEDQVLHLFVAAQFHQAEYKKIKKGRGMGWKYTPKYACLCSVLLKILYTYSFLLQSLNILRGNDLIACSLMAFTR